MTTVQELSSKRKEYWGKFYYIQRLESTVIPSAGRPSTQQSKNLIVIISNKLENTGFTILESVRISMLKNNIQMCVDSKFNKYEVPIFCINEPLSYGQ